MDEHSSIFLEHFLKNVTSVEPMCAVPFMVLLIFLTFKKVLRIHIF